MSTALDNCNLALDFVLKFLQILITASAAFAGAYCTHILTKRRQGRDEVAKYRSLVIAAHLDVTFQIAHTRKILEILRGAESTLVLVLNNKAAVNLPLLNFVSQAASFAEIRKTLLPFRADARLYAEISNIEGWTNAIVGNVNEQYNKHASRLVEHVAALKFTEQGNVDAKDTAPSGRSKYDRRTFSYAAELLDNLALMNAGIKLYLGNLEKLDKWLDEETGLSINPT